MSPALLPFLKNMLIVLRGAVLGQGIVFLALPWLSRLYDPQDFGVMQSFQSLLSLLLILCSLRLEVAILRASESELRHVVAICVFLCLISSVVTLFVIVLLKWLTPTWFFGLSSVIWLLPASLLLAGISQVCNYICLRRQALGINADGKIAQSLTYVAVAGGVGLASPSALALNLADLLGRLALVLASWRGALRQTLLDRATLSRESLTVLSRFRSLPLFSMPSAAVNTLGSSFTPLMMLALFGANEAGNFAMIERLLGTPIAVIAGAASQAFMAAFSGQSLVANEKRVLFLRILRTSALLGFAPTIVLMAVGQDLLPLLLGDDWQLAGRYVGILAPMLYISLLATPVNMTLVIGGHYGLQFLWDSGRLVSLALMWWAISAGQYDSITAVSIYSAIVSIFYILHIVLSYCCVNNGLGSNFFERN
ncbi:lipopolysaccharide biosynthesis protein [Rhodoferax sp. U11-2br]|uniref:lipopolysaccharide biosynthesis protein n=1 Tax=Rhodoferax sp. U11-2br TaxID=2838878 RepID=UPI001BE917AB|nr:oligosaccharide flippase family protein [Rhodoferax sp. U11-2br]MBT3068361.1 oligosaccharide flippase family protein [Rhodoferax sp. U11-2br]